MVTICTKKFCQPTIQERVLARRNKNKDEECLERFLEELKERSRKNSRVLSGTTVPNSTFKNIYSEMPEIATKKNESVASTPDNNDKLKSSTSINSKKTLTSSIRTFKPSESGKEASSVAILKMNDTSRTRSSVLSDTSTMEELKELRDLLRKSSYVPEKIKTRRPTIEKIKSAIEHEKEKQQQQLLVDKNESTTNDSIALSDASTGTEKKKKRRKSVNKSVTSSQRNSSTRSVGVSNNNVKKTKQNSSKTKNIKKKKNEKIDIEIQCSIFKMIKEE